MDNIFQSALDCFSAEDDDTIEKRNKQLEQDAMESEIRSCISDTEKRLKAPTWWTLDNFKPGAIRCFTGTTESGLNEAIEGIKSGLSAIISAAETGVGKSHLAVAIAREVAKTGRRCSRYKDFTLFRLAEVDRFRSNGGLADAVLDAKNADYLILDDVGKNQLYRDGLQLTYYGNVLFDIVDHRAEQRKPTIITTRAKSKDELDLVLGADFVRRVKMDEGDKKTSVSIFL